MYKNIILSALLLSTGNATAQSIKSGDIFTERQQYLIDNLSFYYVPNPNNETGKAYKLDNPAIASGTREGPFWEDTTLAPLSQLVAKLICKPLGGLASKGDEFVQEKVFLTFSRGVTPLPGFGRILPTKILGALQFCVTGQEIFACFIYARQP